MWIYYLLVNIAAFISFGIDKRAARKNSWRTSEAVLLGLALAGGFFGAYLGMKVFHHKTKKPKFKAVIIAAMLFHGKLIFDRIKK